MSTAKERFQCIVIEHSDLVLRYVRNRLNANGSVAPEDVVGEVMSIAWERLDRIPEGFEGPWLLAVARNRIMNEHSKGARRKRIAVRIRPQGVEPSAEESWIADESLRVALAQLSAKDREAVLLTYWEGLSPSELAVALGVSPRSAAVRLSRAKQSLLRLLAGDSGGH